jgi:TnpA family transposase
VRFRTEAPQGDTGEDALARRWTLTTADTAEVLRARGAEHRLRCAVQLCTLRATGRFVADYRRVPPEAVNHLALQLGLDPVLALPDSERPATESAHFARLRRHLGWGEFDHTAEQKLRERLQERVAEGMTPGPLLALAEDLLRAARVVLPAPSTLERLVASVAAHTVQELFERIAAGLPERLREAIEDLVDVPEGEHRSSLAHLKEPPPAARAKAISSRLARLDLLDGLLGAGADLSTATPQMQQHLAQLGRRYDAQALKRFAAPKRYALVAAFLVETRKGLLDQLVAMHDQYMTGLERRSRLAFEAKYRARRRRAKAGLDILLDAVDVMLDTDRGAPISRLYETITEAELRGAATDCRAFARLEERGLVDELAARYADLRRYLPAFLRLPFEAAAGSETLLAAIEVTRRLDSGASEALLDDAPRHFVPAAWRKMACPAGQRPRRALWEIALAFAVRDALRSGDLFLAASRRHVSFWNLLMDEQQWAEAKRDVYACLPVPHRPDEALGALRARFDEAAGAAAGGLSRNLFARIQDGELRLQKPDALPITPGLRKLRAVIAASLPQVRVEDMLRQVDRWTGLARALTPLGGYEPRGGEDTYRTLLAALIAHGTNLGVAAMAGSIEGMTPDRLHHASRWFLREVTLKAANKAVVDHHHALPFSVTWGDGTLSSSDGQRFAVQRDGLLGAVYPRYFGYYDRAITLYTHISDRFGVFATQAISCAPREAGYVLDGLLENDTLVRPLAHTTDTHGFTEQLFGLCHLLGIAFMPRLKDLPDQQLYKLDRGTDYGPFEPLFRGVVDTVLIAEQWDQLVRIAASLRDRTAPAHVVLQRLINASPADRVSKALTALGRACKTLFILRYIHEEPTRLAIQSQLNRGEARHALARWLFFANRGEFRVADYEEVMSKASCLGLLSNAAVLWNTVQIERVVGRLRTAGAEIDPADLAHVWPLQHARIIPNGTYFLGWPQDEAAEATPV